MLEQSILCELKTFTKALFVWFATHYIFNLEYDHHIKETALFYQEICLVNLTLVLNHPLIYLYQLTLKKLLAHNLL